jgi:hypothetical protein
MSSKCEASFTVAKPENGFGLSFLKLAMVLWRKPSHKPHKFDITTTFFLERSRGMHAIEIAVNIEF